VAGVEPQSETNWRYASDGMVPRICYINKLDRMGASYDRSFGTILNRLSKKAVRMHMPLGEEENFDGIIDLLTMKEVKFTGDKGKDVSYQDIQPEHLEEAKSRRAEMIEKIVETDENMMTQYLEGKEFTIEELKAAIRKATIANELFPVFCGSSLKNRGVQLVLDAVVDYLPSPLDIARPKGLDPLTGESKELEVSDTAPFAALAFKSMADPFVGQLTFFRVYSGTLESGSYIYNATKDKKERVSRILRMHANEREEVKVVYAGEIAAAVGLKDTVTSDTMCTEENPIILEKIVVPEPVISMRIEPKTKADQEKMGLALSRLATEDPTFRVSSDQETNETIIAGMGELHLDIIVDRMKREFSVEATTGKPQVAYKETIQGSASGEGKYIKQSGGRGQYGHVKINIKPIDYSIKKEDLPKAVKRYDDFEFINSIKGGVIPQEYVPAVEKGLREAMDRGTLAGFKMVDVSCEVYDGSFHEVDSSEIAFKLAAGMALADAVSKAKPAILEPIMKVEVVTPDKFYGDITGNLSSMRGQIEGMGERGQDKVINAMVPLSEMFGYVNNLRSMTEGRATFTMEFGRYDVVPANIAKEIAENKK
jgi:elongation factor G